MIHSSVTHEGFQGSAVLTLVKCLINYLQNDFGVSVDFENYCTDRDSSFQRGAESFA